MVMAMSLSSGFGVDCGYGEGVLGVLGDPLPADAHPQVVVLGERGVLREDGVTVDDRYRRHRVDGRVDGGIHGRREHILVEVPLRDGPLPFPAEPAETDTLGRWAKEGVGVDLLRHDRTSADDRRNRSSRSVTLAGVCPSHFAARSRTGTWNRSQSAIS